MKVLIIGAKGTLGQALAEVFVSSRPLLWDREEIDITDFAVTREKINAAKPDVILNCAAYNDVDGAEDNAEIASKLNGEAPKNLAEIANEIDAVLVQYGTVYVFDGENRDGYKEDDNPRPLGVYGQSKLLGERGAAVAKKYYILRLDRLFGKVGGGKKSFVDKIMEAALVQKQLRIVDEEEGSPTYAPDLAERTKYVLENKLPYGVYHAANSGSCTWYGFTQRIFKIAGIGVELLPISSDALVRKARRPKYAILLNTKMPAMRPWEEALSEYLTGN